MSFQSSTLLKKRIDVIDALRGFALMGILLLHCTEHFELFSYPQDPGVGLKFLNNKTSDLIQFLFLGKSYAIFSFLFGLSFFIQMDNEAQRGGDFRARFAWRMILLLGLGAVNSFFYSGEIFVVYAILGLLLIPAYKMPVRLLAVLSLLFLLKLPVLIQFFMSLGDPELANAGPMAIKAYSLSLWPATQEGYKMGTFFEVGVRNLWEAQLQKLVWFFHSSTYLHIIGLFLGGLIVGRLGIHKDEDKMIRYATRAVLIGLPVYALFYCIAGQVPSLELGKEASRVYRAMFNSYANIGMMLTIMGTFILAYFRLGARRTLDYLAPVGRMSLTNYMAQSVMGGFIFYGYGLGLAASCGQFSSALIGVALCALQIAYSNAWMKRYYYGPVEWVWRRLTWMRPVPMKRTA